LDVLTRYRQAAEASGAGIIMRITADCPLLSPELCATVLRKLVKTKADYASNVEPPRTFPKGFDCEVFTIRTLRRADEEAAPNEREHVTTWMQRADIKRASVKSPWPLDGRLTLDTWDDYVTICAAFGHEPHSSLRAA
jgi:spore coat polysaccharide biosynthesis protein SpsF (cytidylyltransferase family)